MKTCICFVLSLLVFINFDCQAQSVDEPNVKTHEGDADAQGLAAINDYLSGVFSRDQKVLTGAHQLAQQSARQGSPYGFYAMGWMLKEGVALQRDESKSKEFYSLAIPEFRKRAESGDPDAQCYLGRCYWAGNGVEKDTGEAAKWLAKSAEQGNAEAKSTLQSIAAQKETEKPTGRFQLDPDKMTPIDEVTDPVSESVSDSEKTLRMYLAADSGENFFGGPDTRSVMALTLSNQVGKGSGPTSDFLSLIKSYFYEEKKLSKIRRLAPRKDREIDRYPVRLVFVSSSGGEERQDFEFFKDQFDEWSATRIDP